MTNKYAFGTVVGKEWSMLSGYLLYYQAPDGKETCKDFQQFGGWHEAMAKVFKNGLEICGNSVDHMLWCNAVVPGAIVA